MIVGIDNYGKIYMSLLQANSNTATMRLFFAGLIRKLDEESAQWYRNTVIMIDNAPYHTSSASMKVFAELGVPVLFTGPHSYSACPAELVFAAFKARDINPRKVPTSK